MISPGQICRDRACKTFKVAIVLDPSCKEGKLRACRWQPSDEPSGGHWTAPRALFERALEPLAADFDLTSRHGQVVSAAKRSIVDGIVRWRVGGHHAVFTEMHYVETVRP